MELFLVVPRTEVKHHKMLTDYRMYKSNGSMFRVVEQQLCLEFDKRGNLWLALSILDISPDQDVNLPAQARLLNFNTGKLYDFPPASRDVSLTRREKEILGLLSKELISKQIADRLFISVNTVNTHRQRIIEKLCVTNTAEAIQYGLKLGVL
ncbi:MAG: helix-turn-helix domain-containing protein [Bacteroidota bacterium]